MTDMIDTAEVERREPDYSAGGEYAFPAGQVGRHNTPVEDLGELPHTGRPTAISIETRKLVVVEWGSIAAGPVVADGTGLADIDLGRVPANQWWLLDSLQVRGGAAGNALVYDAGQVGAVNDLDLIAAGVMAGPAFVASILPPACYIKPGRQVIVRTIGAGAAASITARMLYRIATLAYGQQLVTA